MPYGTGAPAASNYANFGSRLGAVLIDGFVTAAIALPFELIGFLALRKSLENCYSYKDLDGTSHIRCPDGALQGGWLAAAIALFVIGLIVAVIVYCRKVAGGQSWGHKVTNIRIVDAQSGQSISAVRVFLRQICRIFSQFLCFLGYLWMLWDSRSQTWHDKMVGTVVIKA